MAEAAKKNDAAKEPKAPKAKKIQGHTYDSRISYGTDGEGKRYGAEENNPKRGGAKTRFALYEKCRTIQDAIDAGMKPEDVGYDIRSKFITVEA